MPTGLWGLFACPANVRHLSATLVGLIALTGTPVHAQRPGEPPQPPLIEVSPVSPGAYSISIRNSALNPYTNKFYYVAQTGMRIVDIQTKQSRGVPGFNGADDYDSLVTLNFNSNRIYVTHPSGTLTAINLDTYALQTLTIPERPSVLAVNTLTNQVYVASHDDGVFTQIDETTFTIVGQITLGHKRPMSIAVVPRDEMIYINYEPEQPVGPDRGYVTQIKSAWAEWGKKATLTATDFQVEDRPGYLVQNYTTGKIYYPLFGNNEVIEFDGATRQTTRIPVLGDRLSGALAVNWATNTIFALGKRSISIIDGATRAVRTVDVGEETLGVVVQVNPTNNRAYAMTRQNNLVVMDVGTESIGKYPLESVLGAPILVNTGAGVYVTTSRYLASVPLYLPSAKP